MGFDLGQYAPIKLPQAVQVTNNRLACCQLCCQITTVLLLGMYFISARLYVTKLIPEGKINAWGSVNSDMMPVALAADQAGAICGAQGAAAQDQYGFWYDDFFQHHDYQCKPLPVSESSFKIGKTQLYFPTYAREQYTENAKGTAQCNTLSAQCGMTAAGNCPATFMDYPDSANYVWGQNCFSQVMGSDGVTPECTCASVGHLLVAGVAARKMAFEHSFEVTTEYNIISNGGVKTGFSSEKEEKAQENDRHPMLTVIMTYDDEEKKYTEYNCGTKFKPPGGDTQSEQCRFGPGESPSMMIEDWAVIAGYQKGQFSNPDYVNPDICGNGMAAAGMNDCAPLRLTGIEILVTIDYKNNEFHEEGNTIPDDWMVAYVTVKSNPGQWTGLPRLAYGDPQFQTSEANADNNSQRYRYYYGVRFLFGSSTMSEYGSPSLAETIISIAVIKVYFGLATLIVSLFALTILGNLSKNYKKAAVTKLNYDAEASYVVPTKMLCAMGCYYSLINLFEKVKEIDIGDTSNPALRKTTSIDAVKDKPAAAANEKDMANANELSSSKEAANTTTTEEPTAEQGQKERQVGSDDEAVDLGDIELEKRESEKRASNQDGMHLAANAESDKSETDHAPGHAEERVSAIEQMFGGNNKDPVLERPIVRACIDRLFCDGEVVLDPWEVDELTDRFFKYLGDDEKPGEVGLKQFVQAFTQNEKLDFVGIYKQFDKELKRQPFELLFAEKYGEPKPIYLKPPSKKEKEAKEKEKEANAKQD